jgi:hypothetical protein
MANRNSDCGSSRFEIDPYDVKNPCFVLINNFIEDEETMKRENRTDDEDAARMRSSMMKLKDFFQTKLGFMGLRNLTYKFLTSN